MRLFLLSFFSAVFFFADAQTCAIDSNNFEKLRSTLTHYYFGFDSFRPEETLID
jgi:hypothetical protein